MWDTDPYLTNNDSVTYHFNTAHNPISDFDITVDQRSDSSRERSQRHGLWPTFAFRGGMTIDITGNILADDMADYVTKRQAMVNAIWGANFDGLVSESSIGTYFMQPSGEVEVWKQDIQTLAFTAAKTWSEGAFSPYMVTFFAFTPWFVGVDDDTNKYRWS